MLFGMLPKLILLSLIFFLVSSTNLYEAHPEIQFLNKENFSKVYKGIWLVDFYAHWCVYSKNFVKRYVEAAKELKGVVNVAAINSAIYRTHIAIRTVPQIKLFVNGKRIDYNGPTTAKEIVSFVRRNLNTKS